MSGLREVAVAAGVSVATASRALNDSPHRVSSRTRERVRRAAERLGYRPSATARALRERRSRIIGVLVADVLDPYFGEIARSLEVEASAAGYVSILANSSRDPREERREFATLLEHNASGIVFCGSEMRGDPATKALNAEVDAAVAQGVRVVALAPRGFHAAKLVVDNEATGYELSRYLFSIGHRTVAFLGGLPGMASSEQRAAGYRRAAHEAGARPLVAGMSGMSHTSGKRATAALLDGRRRPTALVCTNDEVAIGAIAELWERGLRVPEDLSIATVGGTAATDVFDLTTIRLPRAELGRLAARYIVREEEALPEVPGWSLHVGRTTGPLGA